MSWYTSNDCYLSNYHLLNVNKESNFINALAGAILIFNMILLMFTIDSAHLFHFYTLLMWSLFFSALVPETKNRSLEDINSMMRQTSIFG